MILGLGIDIVDIHRVKRIAGEYGDDLLRRVFTEREAEYCRAKKNPEINLAARFAAKEAFLKALGTGLRGKIEWREIEVVNDHLGKPSFELYGAAREALSAKGAAYVHLSITHTADYAAAVVVVEERL